MRRSFLKGTLAAGLTLALDARYPPDLSIEVRGLC